MKFQIKVFWIFNCYLERLSLKLFYFLKSTQFLMLILGFVFWSTSRRKFFTIPEAKSIKLSKNSDDISSASRKSYRPSRYDCNKSQDQLELAFKRRLSVSFISPFEKAFQCCLCKQIPADLPIVSPSSCSTLVGCEAYTVSSTEIALTKDVTNVEPHDACGRYSFSRSLMT